MKRHAISLWVEAARPRTLPAAAAPVVMGTALAYADGAVHAPAALAALLGALFIQIAANYANDYFDFVKGADTDKRIGPRRLMQSGLASPTQMKRAILIVLAFAALPGAYLIMRGGWPILAVGLLSMLFAILYTGGPFPLGYIGVADLFVLVFFGPVAVGGTYYVQASALPLLPLVVGLGPGMLSMAILTVNNLRDIREDADAGKKTLAVRFGAAFARWEYTLAVALAMLLVPPSACLLASGRWGALLAGLAFLPAVRNIRMVWTREGAVLNDCLAASGKQLLLFSLLFSLGWIAS